MMWFVLRLRNFDPQVFPFGPDFPHLSVKRIIVIFSKPDFCEQKKADPHCLGWMLGLMRDSLDYCGVSGYIHILCQCERGNLLNE